MNMRLTVQFARGGNRNTREPGGAGGGGGGGDRGDRGGGSNGAYGHSERPPPRPRRTAHRMNVTGLQSDTSWQVSCPLHSLPLSKLDCPSCASSRGIGSMLKSMSCSMVIP